MEVVWNGLYFTYILTVLLMTVMVLVGQRIPKTCASFFQIRWAWMHPT